MSDILERLGHGIDNIYAFSEVELLDSACGRLEAALGIGQAVKYMEDAGTEIARLREENERLVKERDEALAVINRLTTVYKDMEDGNGDPCPDVRAALKFIAKQKKAARVSGAAK